MPLQRTFATVEIMLQEWDAILCARRCQHKPNILAWKEVEYLQQLQQKLFKALSGNI